MCLALFKQFTATCLVFLTASGRLSFSARHLSQDFGFGEKRATEFLEKFRETFEAYASLCLENAKGDANMDYTKGCIDRELARIMGSAFQPWEVRYPEKVFGGK